MPAGNKAQIASTNPQWRTACLAVAIIAIACPLAWVSVVRQRDPGQLLMAPQAQSWECARQHKPVVGAAVAAAALLAAKLHHIGHADVRDPAYAEAAWRAAPSQTHKTTVVVHDGAVYIPNGATMDRRTWWYFNPMVNTLARAVRLQGRHLPTVWFVLSGSDWVQDYQAGRLFDNRDHLAAVAALQADTVHRVLGEAGFGEVLRHNRSAALARLVDALMPVQTPLLNAADWLPQSVFVPELAPYTTPLSTAVPVPNSEVSTEHDFGPTPLQMMARVSGRVPWESRDSRMYFRGTLYCMAGCRGCMRLTAACASLHHADVADVALSFVYPADDGMLTCVHEPGCDVSLRALIASEESWDHTYHRKAVVALDGHSYSARTIRLFVTGARVVRQASVITEHFDYVLRAGRDFSVLNCSDVPTCSESMRALASELRANDAIVRKQVGETTARRVLPHLASLSSWGCYWSALLEALHHVLPPLPVDVAAALPKLISNGSWTRVDV
jgi:hypothetical protein